MAVTLDNPSVTKWAASIEPSIEAAAAEEPATSHWRSTYVWLTARVQKSLRSAGATESVLRTVLDVVRPT
ncbi:hypothetical protein Rhow_001119 [Rhodococcus wratislaviensis]|uniref:Uncharacterized protein n=1 Tax=Rhodococcus wratislaviensis TaxID=44752 RepID=A0A402CN07_RHOWR|nr:hypothetical protein Rhow_001119 [Rhodococcus wratislaviensis]